MNYLNNYLKLKHSHYLLYYLKLMSKGDPSEMMGRQALNK